MARGAKNDDQSAREAMHSRAAGEREMVVARGRMSKAQQAAAGAKQIGTHPQAGNLNPRGGRKAPKKNKRTGKRK